MLSRFERDVSC